MTRRSPPDQASSLILSQRPRYLLSHYYDPSEASGGHKHDLARKFFVNSRIQQERDRKSGSGCSGAGWLVGLSIVRVRGRLIGFASPLLGLCQIEYPEKLLREDEILGAENLVGARVVQVSKDDLGIDKQLALEKRLGLDHRSFTSQVLEGDLVDQLVTGAGHAQEISSGNLGEDDLLGEPTRFSDQDPSGLGQPFDDQRGGHDRIAGEMIVQMLLSQCEVLDRPRELAAAKFQELVDPDPTHRRKGSPQEKKGGEGTRRTASSPGKPAERGQMPSRRTTPQVRPRPVPKQPLHLTTAHATGSGRQLALNIMNQHVDRVKIPDIFDVGIGSKLAQVGVRQPGLELADALAGQLAVRDPFRIGHQVLGEQLTAWDLDPEIPLQTEDDVQKINRFGAQVPLQGCLLGHVFLVHAQCIHQGRLDFLEDLIVRWHVILRIKGIAAQPQSRPTGRGTKDQVGSLNRRRKRAFNFKGLSSGKASQCVGRPESVTRPRWV